MAPQDPAAEADVLVSDRGRLTDSEKNKKISVCLRVRMHMYYPSIIECNLCIVSEKENNYFDSKNMFHIYNYFTIQGVATSQLAAM